MPNDAPISSLLRVEKGLAAPEELAAITVVVACCASRTARARDAVKRARRETGRRRPARLPVGCWAGCWACR
ncbi:acyl-CoA carboxylase subunit epsilon [Streptomyces sp. NBC_00190]|uniref:acyl-CoA carboxylase subunit epsilon n=1 Tax=unclassified Streptomyces TaxID=2593676 RepID=UPI002E2B73BB|nr:acyl-CoA carboxylase subunit epsilon [Streptomyces sp. NBC_00190]WSZ38786.1 acyl-CoA carboxylase subunit epsilon [Streptomyces sp. NBC_00868]